MTRPPEPGGTPVPGVPAPPAPAGSTARPSEPEPIPLETERVGPPAGATRPKRRLGAVPLAWIVAIVADGLQLLLFPLFVVGAASPVDDIVDVVVAAILIKLLGWHWSFLPGFLVKLAPTIDLAPTWTAAVFFATRGRGKRGGPAAPAP